MPNENCLANLRCPACQQEDALKISCSIMAYVTDDGAEPCDDNHWQWDKDSLCQCPECGHTGKLIEFHIESEEG